MPKRPRMTIIYSPKESLAFLLSPKREREREREICINSYLFIYIHRVCETTARVVLHWVLELLSVATPKLQKRNLENS